MSTSHFKYLAVLSVLGAAAFSHGSDSFLSKLPASPILNVTTVPSNGDVNPYGVAYVPSGFATGGALSPGDILVSNFNNSANMQGTGTSIVNISQSGAQTVFFHGTGDGLTTALSVLRGGYVLVGSVPTADGTFSTINMGSLVVLDKFGNLVQSITDTALLNGPWDMAVQDDGRTARVFISNVLSGTVSRLDITLEPHFWISKATQIGSGYKHVANSAALALGPTGLVYDQANDSLYVASTADNAIYRISGALNRETDASVGHLVYADNAHLRGPLALILAPNGDLIATNGDAVNADANFPSEMVEFTTKGKFVDQLSVDSSGQGGAFGLALARIGSNWQVAAVDDITNTLKVWNVPLSTHVHGHEGD